MNTITPTGNGILKSYRIYFEPVRREESIELLRDRFASASIFTGNGLWVGSFEKLMVFEVHTDVDPLVLHAFAEELRALNSQKSVRITATEILVADINSPV